MYQTFSIKEFRTNLIINCAKISIITLFAIVVLSNSVPFYEATHDSYVYALKSISLTEGTWEVSNKKLSETGEWEFVPNTWKKTIHDTAVPKYPPGLSIMGSISYLVGGTTGLLFLGPFLSIVFLIVVDRVATNLFNKETGLLTILFLASNGIIFVGSIHLLSDNIFTVFILIGFFCIIKFFNQNNFWYLFFASLSLSFTSFLKINGFIYFPIEIMIIVSFIIYQEIKRRRNSNENKFNHNIKYRQIIVGVSIPWLIFILFFVSFNDHYFGDPFITFYNVPDDPWVKSGTGSYFSIFNGETKNFEIIKSYANFVLPYPIYKIEIMDFEKISEERNDPITSGLINTTTDLVSKNNIGILTILITLLGIIFSFYKTNKKRTIIIFSTVIFANIIFWSAGHISFGRDSVLGRYMISAFPFFTIIISYMIVKWLSFKPNVFQKNKKIIIKSFKIFTIIILILFFTVAFYNSPIGQWIIKDNVQMTILDKNEYYPLNLEGLDKESIIVGGHSAKSIDYGFTTFDATIGMPINRTTTFNPVYLDSNVMEKMKSLIENGEELFIFKESVNKNERIFRHVLVDNFDYILSDFSESFCKISIKNKENQISDNNCF